MTTGARADPHYLQVGQSVPQKNPAAGEEAPAEPRAKPTRMFKLLLSDGAREAVAMEFEPSPALDGVRAGSQLFLADVFALRGMLLLTPRCIKSVG